MYNGKKEVILTSYLKDKNYVDVSRVNLIAIELKYVYRFR